ncbi:MAG: M48 family metalloprotease [Bryobacteraceae bacterium]
MRSGLIRAIALTMTPVIAANPSVVRDLPSQADPVVEKAFDDALVRSYEELFRSAATFDFTHSQIEARHKLEENNKDNCERKFKDLAKQLGTEIKDVEKDLEKRSRSLTDSQRRDIHCSLLELRARQRQADNFYRTVVPHAYDNRIAKLTLIEEWPEEDRRIEEEIQSERYMNRRWSNVKDIGFRGVGDGQEKDVKTGSEAIEEMRRNGMLPPEMKDEEIIAYVDGVTKNIASRSDLRIPVKLTLLESPEINAFALPGGFLFINRGLLEAAETEAQLAGVIAHEISHAAARHGHRLMRRATIASIFYQVAQVVALIFTGGAVGIGTYYALQYGFYGLGLVLSLELLGVSRDYELEADQLGVQYAWNAGYDPAGFIRFFDRMATREGYISGASWFRTHPPFYQRMVDSEREMRFLPPREQLLVQTTAFEAMHRPLLEMPKGREFTEPGKPAPSLEAPGLDCPKPKLEYTNDDPLEKLCALPGGAGASPR